MRPTKFKIESLGYEIFDGFTLDEDWNGWACPYFDSNEAERILDIFNKNGGIAKYDDSKDVFIFTEEEIFLPIEIEGKKLYPIGNSYWIWEEM